MTPKKGPDFDEAGDDERGVLDATVDTSAIGILDTATAQVEIVLRGSADDDDLDDDVVDDDPLPPELVTTVIADAELVETDTEAEADSREEDIRETDVVDADLVENPAEHTESEGPESEPAAEAVIGEELTVSTTPPILHPPVARTSPETPAAPTAATEPAAFEPVTLATARQEASDAARERSDQLTAERLLGPAGQPRPEPDGGWRRVLYGLSGHRLNLGDGRRARERKELGSRIAAPLPGHARFVSVLSRKGGVGKTTLTALLGMALADAREDRVIAMDANPDRGTLADRIARTASASVRDLVRERADISDFADISRIVARDVTRLDVLASDTDPSLADAFNGDDYRDAAEVAARFYSLVLTDTGTGMVHQAMGAALDRADQLVVVSGASLDAARLASETLSWLEANGRTDQVRRAIVVLNQSMPGTPPVNLDELERHFSTRVRSVLRLPYDPLLATGGAIDFAALRPRTRTAARELAALVIEGLNGGAGSARAAAGKRGAVRDRA